MRPGSFAFGRLTLLLVVIPQSAGAKSPAPEEIDFFERRIRPVLVDKCYECHSASSKVLQGGLRLDTAVATLAGGDTGPAVIPGNPEESPLIQALRYESYEMPPTGQLPDDVINDFVHWVSIGAPDPRSSDSAFGEEKGPDTSETVHWAFEPPTRAAPPDVENGDWVTTDVDRFILAKLEDSGLSPSRQAPPRALLRRLYYDLSGLAPTAEEFAEFEADPSEARYAATVDRLLAQTTFGERWARYWLDVARYSDTKGYVFLEDRNYKHAYKYRDWVIASFNGDMPYDQFLISQLAADQTPDGADDAASGFLTLGRRFLNNPHDIADDRIDVVTRGLLGLTVACARCHDHKYDPIPTADYYSMYGVFASSEEKAQEEAPPALVDRESPVEPVVFLRGSPGNRGPQVERHFLSCITPDGEPEKYQHGSGRREMAEKIASRENPLTARVWVNRVWGHLLGRPLVLTPSDFGTRGDAPSHPELLDMLACDFMEEGWSTKALVRKLVLSSTYRQASDERGECAAVDPENRLLWRMNRRRADLESMRDRLLLAAGRLDTTIGGPSVQLTAEPFPARRAVYGFIERQNLPAFFRTFDFANPNTHSPARAYTVSPQQALFLMNSPFVIEQALHLAERSRPDDSPDAESAREERIRRLFRFAVGRDPADEELAEAQEFVGESGAAASALAASRPAWQFGWGTFDESTGSVNFQPLPHFTGQTWQGGPELPDPVHGWTMLNATGGHPGDPTRAVIRRWVAPTGGRMSVEGILGHATGEGDGVRARIVVQGQGVVGAWEVHHGETATAIADITIAPGDIVDFIVDCRTGNAYDSFTWSYTLRLDEAPDWPHPVWDSTASFQAKVAPILGRWEQLAQALLMSNEFAFID